MSAEDDNPLVRWSRRKRAARQADAASAKTDAATRDRPADPLAGKAASVETSAPPPSLDDLSAEGDLIAFLKEDVPEHLKRAALRKMWSLDPAIREHVGLAENSWDFNRPDSIPGFGTIAGSSGVSDLFSASGFDAPSASEAPVSSVRTPQAAPEKPVQPASHAAPAPSVVAPAASHSEPDARTTNTDPSDTARPIASRHGGALPRG